jgi:hypothetical protein
MRNLSGGTCAALVPGPAPLVRASEFMHFVYLDEFGHIGPYLSRQSPKHCESPVFGLAGIILPDHAVRPFASYFLQMKAKTFAADIATAKKMPAKWEKKGTSFIRPKPLREYVEARRVVKRVLAKIDHLGGHIFYYGREKKQGVLEGLNPIGFYTTCLSHALRRLDKFCLNRESTFALVVDQHSARKELLECAAKTMFGDNPCRTLVSPPFEVESYINQNMQAADWVATLIGRLTAYEVASEEWADYEYIKKLYFDQVVRMRRESFLEKRPRKQVLQTLDGPFAGLAEFRQRLTGG